mmetsp:Transcript_40848/g.36244  ORF Transcript_40848/g.36244 Transcript_40848/m.36244 type:complete len:84 (-) Transcript_40848:55-306(-)|eukprot:CAMPEP_0114597992 /NCGR_PEP_ID=MMETSP0125-20121206/20347_1 /TAXON_ID=485358 ORGANISM="Aristerostoma sp., Strain ATCC 50986" /NCGR_SAMPLE_ID=MMETSP0125 /ASSEMBLY_ACC=CAM_ASM_000245 /LENGTH=83 /DNA_ID=CAMNT_0001803247 /DNA_START=844 /DNA_END=1095 /DNA_ORIENTATION=-
MLKIDDGETSSSSSEEEDEADIPQEQAVEKNEMEDIDEMDNKTSLRYQSKKVERRLSRTTLKKEKNSSKGGSGISIKWGITMS